MSLLRGMASNRLTEEQKEEFKKLESSFDKPASETAVATTTLVYLINVLHKLFFFENFHAG